MIGAEISGRRIGTEGNPIAIVDGFHPDPFRLRADAIAASFEPALFHYPGVRAPLPDDYFAAVRPALTAALRQVFGHSAGITLLDASFSIVTTPPGRLSLGQCLPHVDAIEPNRVALVHYLDPAGGDGTAFFRHRATGYESLDPERGPHYRERLNEELRLVLPPRAYPVGDSALFEQVAAAEARFNRAVIYRSALLHSGAISTDSPLSADPATGRLTITAFMSID